MANKLPEGSCGIMSETVMTELSLAKFTEYFEKNKLGRLYFPKGNCVRSNGIDFNGFEYAPFFINLDELYKLIFDFNDDLDDIVAVIFLRQDIFNSGSLGIGLIRWLLDLLFGNKSELTQLSVANFLVITKKNYTGINFIPPIFNYIKGKGSFVEEGGINLFFRKFDDTLKNLSYHEDLDTEKRVPIFVHNSFQDDLSDLGVIPVKSGKVLKIFWQADHTGKLTGWIQ